MAQALLGEVPEGFPDNNNFRTANEICRTVLDVGAHAARWAAARAGMRASRRVARLRFRVQREGLLGSLTEVF